MSSRLGKLFFLRSNANPELVAEVHHAKDQPGAAVVLGDPREDSNHNQLWYHERATGTIRNSMNDFCLDLKGDQVVVNPFKGGKGSQLWVHVGQKIQQMIDNDAVLSVPEDEPGHGTAIFVEQDEDRAGQAWSIEHRPVEYIYIRQQEKPSMVMDVAKADTRPGAKVIVFHDKGKMADNQLWYEDENGVIRSKLNGFALDASGNGVVLGPYDPKNDSMQWLLFGNIIRNQKKPSLVLTCQGGGLLGGLFKCPSIVSTSYSGDCDQHWSFEPLPHSSSLNHDGNGKHFFLRNSRSGLVMEVRDGNPDPGTEVVSAFRSPCASMVDHQLFYEDDQTGTIRTALNGYCLDVQNNIALVTPYDPYSETQQWRKFGRKIQHRSKLNMVLQFPIKREEGAPSIAVGENVVAGEYTGADEQFWESTHIAAKTFYITSLLNGKVLDVKRNSPNPGTPVIMFDKKRPPAPNQLWYEDERGIIRSKLNGFVLDSAKNRVVLSPYDPTNEHHQWCIVGDRVQNCMNQQMVLDIEKKNTKNEANICTFKFNGGDNQRWKFETASL